jgi:hypothetical protein
MNGALVKDLAGAYDLTVAGAPTAGVAGRYGKAYNITSPGQYFKSAMTVPGGLLGANPKSLSAWVNVPSTTGGYQTILSFGGGSASPPNLSTFSLELVASNWSLVAYGGSTNDIQPGLGTAISTWHHFVATYDGVLVRLYVDGALINTSNRSLATTTSNYEVGAAPYRADGSDPLTLGTVDEAKVYGVMLSPGEVLQLYELGSRLSAD